MKGPLQFYFDFVLFPSLAILIFSGWCRDLAFFGWAMAGVLLFTLIEYLVHRVALHRFFYHGNHERHHDHPSEYVLFPLWYSPLIFVGFWLVMPLPLFSGMLVGYIWFLYWHHVLHHFDLSTWPRFVQRYAFWHLAHHRRDDCNYGITFRCGIFSSSHTAKFDPPRVGYAHLNIGAKCLPSL